jgi:hypothetical protein
VRGRVGTVVVVVDAGAAMLIVKLQSSEPTLAVPSVAKNAYFTVPALPPPVLTKMDLNMS